MKLYHKYRAFTMVEMLAATALAAVLMVSLVSVAATVNRTHAAMLETSAQVMSPWHMQLVDLLRRDLVNAVQIQTDANTLTISGPCSVQSISLRPDHRPVQIIYALQHDGNQNWLVRRQTYLDDPNQRATRTDIVAGRIARFQLQPVTDRTKAPSAHLDDLPKQGRYQLNLTMAGDQQTAWQTRIRVP